VGSGRRRARVLSRVRPLEGTNQIMTHTKTGHPAPSHLIESYRQGARETEGALLELRTDVLALIDAALTRTRSIEKGRAVTVSTGRDDNSRERLPPSVMFAGVRKS